VFFATPCFFSFASRRLFTAFGLRSSVAKTPCFVFLLRKKTKASPKAKSVAKTPCFVFLLRSPKAVKQKLGEQAEMLI
jgi:hypothetical protein